MPRNCWQLGPLDARGVRTACIMPEGHLGPCSFLATDVMLDNAYHTPWIPRTEESPADKKKE